MIDVGLRDSASYLFVESHVVGSCLDQVWGPVENLARYSELSVHRNAQHEIPPILRIPRIHIAVGSISDHPMIADTRRKFQGASVGQLQARLQSARAQLAQAEAMLTRV